LGPNVLNIRANRAASAAALVIFSTTSLSIYFQSAPEKTSCFSTQHARTSASGSFVAFANISLPFISMDTDPRNLPSSPSQQNPPAESEVAAAVSLNSSSDLMAHSQNESQISELRSHQGSDCLSLRVPKDTLSILLSSTTILKDAGCYNDWEHDVQILLKHENLWTIITRERLPPQNNEFRYRLYCDDKVRIAALLHMTLSPELEVIFADERWDDGILLWNQIKQMFHPMDVHTDDRRTYHALGQDTNGRRGRKNGLQHRNSRNLYSRGPYNAGLQRPMISGAVIVDSASFPVSNRSLLTSENCVEKNSGDFEDQGNLVH
jgi:hypothetical protein